MTAKNRSTVLPWTAFEEEERRFRRILRRVLVVFVLFGMLMPLLPVMEREREEVTKVPDRYAKLLLEKEKKPAPATPKPEPEPKAEEEPAPEPKPKKKAKPEPEPEPKVAKSEPEPKPENKPKTTDKEAARKKAKSAGLLAESDALAELRDNPDVGKLGKKRLSSGASSSRHEAQRSKITSKVAEGSGGINTARLSRDTGGQGLSGRSTTQVSGPESTRESAGSASGTGSGSESGGSRKASRTIEEIQVVFDRNKSSVYALYNRALRRDPTLQGKVVLRLTIAPSGEVTACKIVSSELSAPRLERKLVRRIKLFDFGAKDVQTVTITYPIDFLPA